MEEAEMLMWEYDACMHEWNASYEEYAKSKGLSYTSLSILSTIADTENCTQKMLCETRFLPKQTVNAVVTTFYKKGWLRLEELPEDRRNKTIHFTEEGKAEIDSILKNVRESGRRAMATLTQEERETLLCLTKRYVTACKQAIKEP